MKIQYTDPRTYLVYHGLILIEVRKEVGDHFPLLWVAKKKVGGARDEELVSSSILESVFDCLAVYLGEDYGE